MTTVLPIARRVGELAAAVREAGPRSAGQLVGRRLWSTSESFGLACDLDELPESRRARIDMSMGSRPANEFSGFRQELTRVSGDDYVEVAQRLRMCEAGVGTLFVASDAADAPVYAQWLIGPSEQAALHRVTPKLFPHLQEGESLVEGAYTFSAFRGLGAMSDGMHQLLTSAREAGFTRCLTYVSAGNVPSLRGCSKVGFGLDHVRLTRSRFGSRQVTRRTPTAEHTAAWISAVADRGGHRRTEASARGPLSVADLAVSRSSVRH